MFERTWAALLGPPLSHRWISTDWTLSNDIDIIIIIILLKLFTKYILKLHIVGVSIVQG